MSWCALICAIIFYVVVGLMELNQTKYLLGTLGNIPTMLDGANLASYSLLTGITAKSRKGSVLKSSLIPSP